MAEQLCPIRHNAPRCHPALPAKPHTQKSPELTQHSSHSPRVRAPLTAAAPIAHPTAQHVSPRCHLGDIGALVVGDGTDPGGWHCTAPCSLGTSDPKVWGAPVPVSPWGWRDQNPKGMGTEKPQRDGDGETQKGWGHRNPKGMGTAGPGEPPPPYPHIPTSPRDTHTRHSVTASHRWGVGRGRLQPHSPLCSSAPRWPWALRVTPRLLG